MPQQEDEISRLLGRTYIVAKRVAQRVAQRGTASSDEEAAIIGVLIHQLANAEAQKEYFTERLDLYLNEAQRLALLVRSLGGDPDEGAFHRTSSSNEAKKSPPAVIETSIGSGRPRAWNDFRYTD